MAKANYGYDSRKKMERDEGQPVVKTGAPSDRFSSTMQTSVGEQNVTPAKSTDSAPGDIVVKAAEQIRDKVRVRPTSDATLKENDSVGGVALDGNGDARLAVLNAAGAQTASVVSDQSKIPYTKGGYRPDQRFDRKIADNDFLINNAICEQIEPEFEGTKPIYENPDEKQGYAGRKQFTQARGKKNAGQAPQSTLYDRSVDFIEVDGTVFTCGQVLDSSFEAAKPPVSDGEVAIKSGYPDVTASFDGSFAQDDGYVKGPNMLKSNYVLKSMTVEFDQGKLKAVRFNEDRVDAHASTTGLDMANLNWQIDRNNTVNSVIKLQKELGRETTDKWSPLGYVIKEPYEYNLLCHDIEATTGAIMGAAYRANNTALSFNFNNKIRKDGADPTTPAVDMFLNGIENTSDSSVAKGLMDSAGGFGSAIFNKLLYRKGSAAAIIAMFDTTGKYKTKAAFANYQKSLKFFVQQMDNNIDPLYCKPEFLAALDTAHMYSSFDGSYNPMLPIVATRKISLINPLSLDYFANGFSRDNVGGATGYDEWGLPIKYAYKYSDVRNNYFQNVGHPIVGGITRWILNHEAAWADTFGATSTTEMSCALDMLYPTLFGMILAAASQDILFARSRYFKDFLFAGDQSEYIWSDLKSLSTLNFKSSHNLTISDYKSPLTLGKMKPASALRFYWPEVCSFLGYKDPSVGFDSGDMIMPWYFCENGVRPTFDVTGRSNWLSDEHPYVMAYPERRHGVTHDYIDFLYGLSERDCRLALDRATELPIPVTSAGVQSFNGNIYSYLELQGGVLVPRLNMSDVSSKIALAALRYDDNSDGRVIMHFDQAKTAGLSLTKASILCQPRELGYLCPSLRNSKIVTNVAFSGEPGKDNYAVTFTDGGNVALSSMIDGSMGYALVSYSATGDGAMATNAISRQAALQQSYIKCFSDRSDFIMPVNSAYCQKVGIVPTASGLYTTSGTLSAVRAFIPKTACFYAINSNAADTKVETTGVYTTAKHDWAELNRVFFPVNPFESCFPADDGSVPTSMAIDQLEGGFKYGIAGFFASDFGQDVYSRSERFIELGQFYTEDEFLTSSLALRAD